MGKAARKRTRCPRSRSHQQFAEIVDVAEAWAVGARSDSAIYAETTERATNPANGPSALATRR